MEALGNYSHVSGDVCNFCILFCDRINTGLFCSTPGVAVARSVPKKVALHMLLTAEPLTAQGQLLYAC